MEFFSVQNLFIDKKWQNGRKFSMRRNMEIARNKYLEIGYLKE